MSQYLRPLSAGHLRPARFCLGGLGATALLLAASFPMQRHQLPFWAALCLAYGVVFWLLILHREPPAEIDGKPLTEWEGRPRPVLLALAAALAAIAWWQTGGNAFRAPGVTAWLAALVAWLAAWRPLARRVAPVAGDANLRPGLAVTVVLMVIFACGVWFRLHDLERTPANPTSDHAESLLDVTDLLNGQRPIFFPRNTGREPWKFYWIFVLIKVFGFPAKFLTLKIATAVIGALGIPAVFLLGRELGGDRLGIFAAALVAWNHWPVGISRVGNRFSYAFFPTALVLWALLRYLRRGDRASVLWAGFWIGVGLFGYIPARAVPLLAPVALGAALLDPRWRGKGLRLIADVLLMADTALLVFLPLCHFMVERPDLFWMRAASRAGLPAEWGPVATFARNLGNMAVAFNWRGDSGWVNAVREAPFLDPASSALFLSGVLITCALFARGSRRWLLPLASLFILTLPSTLSVKFPNENPSVNRSIAVAPVVFVIAAVPLAMLTRSSKKLGSSLRFSALAGIAALLALSVQTSYTRYFVDYDRQYDALVEHTMQIAHTIEAYRQKGVPLARSYVLNPAWLDPRNIAFELGDPAWAGTNEIAPGSYPPRLDPRPLLFVFRANDFRGLRALRQIYPGQSERVVRQSHPDRNFGVYLVR